MIEYLNAAIEKKVKLNSFITKFLMIWERFNHRGMNTGNKKGFKYQKIQNRFYGRNTL